ncbi:MAG: WG repeat-containing protein [Flavobacteriales bacterium]|nr:WG repeat-containing protein [Flavobacteriales bacterium]
MNWKEILLSEDMTHFLYKGENPFGKNFLNAMKFHEPGLAPVQDETGWYHIGTEGKPYYPQRYVNAFGYYFMRAAVKDHSGAFHIDENANAIYLDRYQWCGNYQEEICVVRKKSSTYVHIDMQGKVITKTEYLYAGDYKDGLSCVQSDLGWTHIRKNQELLHGRYFHGLGVYHKGAAIARDEIGWFHFLLNKCLRF